MKTKSKRKNVAEQVTSSHREQRLVRLWRWIFPDVSQVKKGTLWISKKRFYEDCWSCHDLFSVRDVCSNGVLFLDCVRHSSEKSSVPEKLRDACVYSVSGWKLELPRTHRLLSVEHAEALGFILPNVKEHATPPAGASVETQSRVHATGDSADKAAGGGRCDSSCSPFFVHGETPDVWIVGMNPESRFDCAKLADQIIVEWNASSVKPKEIILGGVRASIPASWVMQSLRSLGLPVRELTNQDRQVSAVRDRIDRYGCSVGRSPTIPETAASPDTSEMSSVEARHPEEG